MLQGQGGDQMTRRKARKEEGMKPHRLGISRSWEGPSSPLQQPTLFKLTETKPQRGKWPPWGHTAIWE